MRWTLYCAIRMARTDPFQIYTAQYDEWFIKNNFVYEAELQAVRSLLPQGKRGLEIGAGTGRFAVPLGIELGIEPSGKMRSRARERGMKLLGGVAEKLPVKDSTFGFVLMVTTICFVDDMTGAFREAHRVLSESGCLVVGFVDRNSLIGQEYVLHQHENVFYKEATFYCVDEVLDAMKIAGFHGFTFRQTVFKDLSQITEHEVVKTGYGEGSFVVIRGGKK